MVTKLNIHIDFKSTGMLYEIEMNNIVKENINFRLFCNTIHLFDIKMTDNKYAIFYFNLH